MAISKFQYDLSHLIETIRANHSDEQSDMAISIMSSDNIRRHGSDWPCLHFVTMWQRIREVLLTYFTLVSPLTFRWRLASSLVTRPERVNEQAKVPAQTSKWTRTADEVFTVKMLLTWYLFGWQRVHFLLPASVLRRLASVEIDELRVSGFESDIQ